MFLKLLRVVADGQEVRRVDFKRGLNLIVDETPESPKKPGSGDSVEEPKKPGSGNNVGKTTVLRCVDFCLGGKAESMYEDPEFKTVNSAVASFFQNKLPEFILELEDTSGRVTKISRRFGDTGGYIDDEQLSSKDFEQELKSLLFKLRSPHPTLRELVPKFVRVESTAKTNIFRWLKFGKNEQYEAIWLTLFGAKDPKLIKLRRDIKKALARLRQQITALGQVSQSPRQELPVVIRQLKESNKRLQELSLEGAYNSSLDQLARLRADIVSDNQRIASIEASLANVRQTLEIFAEDLPVIDERELKELYEDAEAFIPEVHATYEKLVEFHKTLLQNKTKFVKRNETDLTRQLSDIRKNLDKLLREEASLLRQFADPSVFADVRQISDEIAGLSQRKGELESLEKAMEKLRSDVEAQRNALSSTEKQIKLEVDALEANLEILNRYLTDYSQRLYSERLLVALDLPATEDAKSNISFRIVNLEGNEGSGKKKGQIAAFDLAYLRYCQEKRARTIRFTLQDEVELIDAKQLRTLFEIAQSIDGQYVIPVLKDRLSAVGFPEEDECVIVRLSQGDRFFRLP